MCMWWLFTMLFVFFRVASLVSFGFFPELWGFVRLRPLVFFMDSFFFLAGSQARWPLPLISLLSLLASCFVLSLCCVTMMYASFWFASLVSFGSVPELWGFVRLRPFVFFMDSFFFLAGFQARWPYPRNHIYLCLLVVRSIALSRYLPLVISCLPYCHVNPLTHLPSKPMFGYVTVFAQPLL